MQACGPAHSQFGAPSQSAGIGSHACSSTHAWYSTHMNESGHSAQFGTLLHASPGTHLPVQQPFSMLGRWLGPQSGGDELQSTGPAQSNFSSVQTPKRHTAWSMPIAAQDDWSHSRSQISSS